jgi:hypothetical protein
MELNYASMERAEFRALFNALLSYAEKKLPVVVLDEQGNILHGEETLRAIVDTNASLGVLTIEGINRERFEASDWPEMLEAAREVFMANKEFSPSLLAWAKRNAVKAA